MICSSCRKPIVKPNYASKIYFGPTGFFKQVCRNCSQPSFRTEGVMTRNTHRITQQQDNNAQDIVPPHVWDKATNKTIINPDFVKLYPDKLRYYEDPKDVSKSGYPKLGESMKKQKELIKKEKEKVEFVGDQKKAMQTMLK